MKEETKTGIELIAEERATHPSKGFDKYHDEEHDEGEIVDAAICYLRAPYFDYDTRWGREVPDLWPWEKESWKPKYHDRVRELVKAGALIAAEIDRLQNY